MTEIERPARFTINLGKETLEVQINSSGVTADLLVASHIEGVEDEHVGTAGFTFRDLAEHARRAAAQ
jgi:hypothetical protein